MMLLRRLLCLGPEPSSAPANTQLAATAGAALRPKSLAVNSSDVTKKQVDWLKEEEEGIKILFTMDAKEAEEKFTQLLEKFRQNRSEDGGIPPDEAEMSKSEMRDAFAEMGIAIAPELFEKMWQLIDADKSGTVNKSEFVVAFCVLMYRGSAKDNVQLAFRLFDTNRDGGISRREFNDMIASIIGTKMRNVLAIELGRECFEEFLQKGFTDELLRFVDAVEFLREDRTEVFDRDYADSLFEQFLRPGARDQVNVSDKCLERTRAALAACEPDGPVPATIFDEAAQVAVQLLEQGPLVLFKDRLHTTYELFADKVWADLGKEKDDTLTEFEFRTWAERTPGLFAFFDDLHDLLKESLRDPK